MTRGYIPSNRESVKEEVGSHVVKAIADLEERFDCTIYLDRDDVELHGSDEFYEQIMRNINKHRFEWP